MEQRTKKSNDAILRKNTRIGVRMTVLYTIVYGGFVAVCVFRPSWTGARALFGLNLAVFYGLALIVIAILFALIYNYLCRVPPSVSGDKKMPPSVSGKSEEG